jgi:hypothetical protein
MFFISWAYRRKRGSAVGLTRFNLFVKEHKKDFRSHPLRK